MKNVVICPKCGGKVADQELTCPRCGEMLSVEVDPRLQEIYQKLLQEKERVEIEQVVADEKPKNKKKKKGQEPEDPFERVSTGFSAVKMVGPEYGKVKPKRKIFRMIVLMLLTLASLGALYLSFPLDKDVVIRGFEPALYFIRGFAPNFLAKGPCGFEVLTGYGYVGVKAIVVTALPYVSLVTIASLLFALITLCFGARYRRGVRFFVCLFLWLALLGNVVQVVGYCLLYKMDFKPFPYGGLAAIGVALLTLIVFCASYQKPKKKG